MSISPRGNGDDRECILGFQNQDHLRQIQNGRSALACYEPILQFEIWRYTVVMSRLEGGHPIIIPTTTTLRTGDDNKRGPPLAFEDPVRTAKSVGSSSESLRASEVNMKAPLGMERTGESLTVRTTLYSINEEQGKVSSQPITLLLNSSSLHLCSHAFLKEQECRIAFLLLTTLPV